jgi:carboxymethylenebutenolidase
MPSRANTSPRLFPLLIFSVFLALCLLPLAACEGPDEVDEVATEEEVQMDEGTTTDDDYAERMAEQHAGEEPVPAFAGNDERYREVEVATEEVEYATVDGRAITGYLAMPEGAEERPDAALPGLIVIHEWWGLNDNVETMARLFAHHGYVALAVDLYGERAESPERARELMGEVDEAQAEENLRQAYRYLVEEHNAPRVGVVGWCFGGGWSLRTALALPEEIDATVVYYGRLIEDRDRLATLDMPILGIFGAEDQGIPVAGVRRFESTLEDLGKDVEIQVYEGAGHAFANPSGERYQPEAARDAWQRTLEFLESHLKQ